MSSNEANDYYQDSSHELPPEYNAASESKNAQAIGQDDSLREIFRLARKHPLLPLSEEWKLIESAQSGDKRALNKLLRHSYRRLLKVILRYTHGRIGPEFSDLFQEGLLIISKAIMKFDRKKGKSLWCLVLACLREPFPGFMQSEYTMIRLPENVWKLIGKIIAKSHPFSAEFGREPGANELAVLLNETTEHIQQAMAAQDLQNLIRLDAPLGDDSKPEDTLPASDKLLPDSLLDYQFQRTAVLILIAEYPRVQKKVLELRLGIKGEILTQVQVANQLGITKQVVNKVEKRAVLKLGLAMKAAQQAFPGDTIDEAARKYFNQKKH